MTGMHVGCMADQSGQSSMLSWKPSRPCRLRRSSLSRRPANTGSSASLNRRREAIFAALADAPEIRLLAPWPLRLLIFNRTQLGEAAGASGRRSNNGRIQTELIHANPGTQNAQWFRNGFPKSKVCLDKP